MELKRIFKNLKGVLNRITRRKTRKRGLEGAATNRLNYNWAVSIESADSILRVGLRALRVRSRDLALNNDYVKKFIKMVVNNVIGASGIRMQSKSKFGNGKLDKNSNDLIEAGWKKWGKRGICDVTGTMGWIDLQRLIIETVAKDGEIIIRQVNSIDNGFRYSLQLLEADYLDEDYNKTLSNGNKIRMGIELNSFGKPVYYHLRTAYPNEATYFDYSTGTPYVKVPANEIIHLYIRERPSQSRGIPWCHSAMTRVHNIGAYEEAEIIAARTAASKMGFFETEKGNVKYEGDEKDDDGNVITEVEPGLLETLPAGLKFSAFDPHHPSGNFDSFMKRMLKGVSSGMLVSYNSLSNDLEAVNFSSIRSGTLEERDHWKVLQSWFTNNFCDIVYENWLKAALLTMAVNLPYEKFDKYNQPSWQGRGWSWVDPLKDVKAAVEAVNNGLRTRSSVVAEYGMDYEEIVEMLKQEEDLIKEHGITINPGKQSNITDQNIKDSDSADSKEGD